MKNLNHFIKYSPYTSFELCCIELRSGNTWVSIESTKNRSWHMIIQLLQCTFFSCYSHRKIFLTSAFLGWNNSHKIMLPACKKIMHSKQKKNFQVKFPCLCRLKTWMAYRWMLLNHIMPSIDIFLKSWIL